MRLDRFEWAMVAAVFAIAMIWFWPDMFRTPADARARVDSATSNVRAFADRVTIRAVAFDCDENGQCTIFTEHRDPFHASCGTAPGASCKLERCK
jgi:hypothetical protein